MIVYPHEGTSFKVELRTPAVSEAFRVILTHEKIPYTLATGAGGMDVYFFEDINVVKKLHTSIEQWHRAVNSFGDVWIYRNEG